MKKISAYIFFSAIAVMGVSAQSAIDGYNISQTDLRGTARFMSMAGAFGALGGDISTLNQNPAGIGVYRSSEVALTLGLDMQSITANGYSTSQTKFYCNNFGYVGSLNLNGDTFKTFNWGASYNRKATFDRNYRGSLGKLPTSLSNYIASFSNGIPGSDLLITDSYNPYLESNEDWLSILGYNSMLINPIGYAGTSYDGLFDSSKNTEAEGDFYVSEHGYIDEYSINFGGNISDVVFWGLGLGITDLRFTQFATYHENLNNANIPTQEGLTGGTGHADFTLGNMKQITGSGYNVKLGIIVKPIEQLRLGIAFHTPNWYSLSQNGEAYVDYNYYPGQEGNANPNYAYKGSSQTDFDYFYYKMRSPWRLILSAAGVVGGRFIISADYEMDSYESINFSDTYWTDFSMENQDFKDYFQTSSTFRIGAEYRLTPQLSVRAGFSHTGDNVKSEVYNQTLYPVYTSGPYLTGTNPAYTFNRTTEYYTLGLGYKIKKFYVDFAYAYRSRSSVYQPFTKWQSGANIPTAELNQADNNLVLTVGYKF